MELEDAPAAEPARAAPAEQQQPQLPPARVDGPDAAAGEPSGGESAPLATCTSAASVRSGSAEEDPEGWVRVLPSAPPLGGSWGTEDFQADPADRPAAVSGTPAEVQAADPEPQPYDAEPPPPPQQQRAAARAQLRAAIEAAPVLDVYSDAVQSVMMEQLFDGPTKSNILPGLDLGRAGDTVNRGGKQPYTLCVCATNAQTNLHESFQQSPTKVLQLPIIPPAKDVGIESFTHAGKLVR